MSPSSSAHMKRWCATAFMPRPSTVYRRAMSSIVAWICAAGTVGNSMRSATIHLKIQNRVCRSC